jgi:exopolyphosphatase/guanosine-5'-triphosphate,3'-diphosphate pyrophosphatase
LKIIYSLNLKIDVFGGIDIGSNAVRLLIAHVVSANDKLVAIRKVSLVRVPIRLGSDVYLTITNPG